MKPSIRYSLLLLTFVAGAALAGPDHDHSDGHTHGADEPETEAFYGDESPGKHQSDEHGDHHGAGDEEQDHHEHHDESAEHGENHSHDDGHDHGGDHGHDH